MRRVSFGMRWRTLQDLNYGFGDRTGSCREYTLSRDDPQSDIMLWTTGNTEIGPVLEVMTCCQLDVHGIEFLTWLSYDEMTQMVLLKALKKLIMAY